MGTIIYRSNSLGKDNFEKTVGVIAIVCPEHGDVTEEVGVKREFWPMYATLELLRSGPVHRDGVCEAQLLWELERQEAGG